MNDKEKEIAITALIDGLSYITTFGFDDNHPSQVAAKNIVIKLSEAIVKLGGEVPFWAKNL